MENHNRLRRESGFTIIELLLTLALVGLVIVGGARLYFFANRSFVSGQIVADIQADIQIAMKRITEEVRLAHSLKLIDLDDVPTGVASLEEDDHYLYWQAGKIVLKTEHGTRAIIGVDEEYNGYNLFFSTVDDEDLGDVLKIKIAALHPKVDYELESELQILNLRHSGSVLKADIGGLDNSQAIYFTKTFTEEEYEASEEDPRRCFLRRHVYAAGAEELDVLRSFRDSVLMPTRLGRIITDYYYANSPRLSFFLEERPLAVAATKMIFDRIAIVVSAFI